jgi:uncharacterized membrane protein
MPFRSATPERLNAFSDGAFAVLITVLVLELRPPEAPTFEALLQRWPTWLSYAVSYLFIAIVWTIIIIFYAMPTRRPLACSGSISRTCSPMSLLLLSTAWMAVSRLAPQPVAFYAAVFFLVNATYVCLIWELIDTGSTDEALRKVRRIMRYRSIGTLLLFALAALVALKFPVAGLGICVCCLIVYLRPDPPGA